MIRTCVAFLLAIGLTAPAFADVTIKQMTGGKGLGFSGKASATTHVKGNKMRTDTPMGDKVQTTIFDLDAQKMYMFESNKKEADVWDMAAFASQIGSTVDISNMKASLKPNGQTKQFGAHSAAGYDMEITVPATIAGNKDQPINVTLSGPVWIVRDGPRKAGSLAIRARRKRSQARRRRCLKCIGSSPRSAASRTRQTSRSR
jgi:hypothetical protein